MEERKSWLPAGLEGSGWEPDDRASQQSGPRSKRSGDDSNAFSAWQPKAEKPADQGPSASSGTWQPYDPDRPESKRTRTDDEPAEDRPEARKTEPETGKTEPETPRDEPKSREAEPKARKDEAKAEGERDRQEDGRSDVDAMGQEKHRPVVGQRYGASRAKQLLYYGGFVAFVVAAYLGLKIAVDNLDKAPARDKDQAPWSQPNAPDEPLGGFTPKDKGAKGPTNFQ